MLKPRGEHRRAGPTSGIDDARPARLRMLDMSTAVLCTLGLAAPGLAWLVGGVQLHMIAAEERVATPLPAAPRSLSEFSRFPKAFEAWHADRFGIRATLLRARSAFVWHLFGCSPTPVADMGPHRWPFLAGPLGRAVHRGAQPLVTAQIEAWRRVLDSRARFCADHGARYLFISGPNKSTVYPDQLPPTWSAVVGPTRLAQLARAFADDRNTAFFDVREVLQAARADDEGDDLVYYPLGTHWTDRGALAVTRAILEHLRPNLPRLGAIEVDALEIESGQRGDDWRSRLYLDHIEGQSVPSIARVHGVEVRSRSLPKVYMEYGGPRADAPSLLCFHDSFGDAPQRLLTHAFAESRFVWDDFDPDLIARVRPDVVLEIYVERLFEAKVPAPVERPHPDVEQAFERGEPLASLALDRERFELPTGVLLRWRDSFAELDFRENRRGVLKLPAIDLDPARVPIVRIAFEAPPQGNAFVFTPRPLDREFDRSHMQILPFSAEKPTITCRLDDMSEGRIGLVFAPTTEVWKVRAIEVRSAPR